MRGQNDALFPASCCDDVAPLSLLRSRWPLVPAKVDLAWAIGSLFDQGLVKLAAGTRVDVSPTELTVVLQASDIGAEEGCELAPTACPLALIAKLVIQDIGLHLHLQGADMHIQCTQVRKQSGQTNDHKRTIKTFHWFK